MSPIRSVIIQVITKLYDREAGVLFVNHESRQRLQFSRSTKDKNTFNVIICWNTGTRSAYHLHGIFGWDFWDKWNSLFLPVKTRQNTMLYHYFVKNDPVELSRLGRLVPRFTKSSTVGEGMARVRFLQMAQLIAVILVETKKEEYLRRHSFDSRTLSPG